MNRGKLVSSSRQQGHCCVKHCQVEENWLEFIGEVFGFRQLVLWEVGQIVAEKVFEG